MVATRCDQAVTSFPLIYLLALVLGLSIKINSWQKTTDSSSDLDLKGPKFWVLMAQCSALGHDLMVQNILEPDGWPSYLLSTSYPGLCWKVSPLESWS